MATRIANRSKLIFAALSTSAFITLWVQMALNGVLLSLLKTAWNGQFPDGSAFNNIFTGIWPLDFPLSILIAFFYGLQNMRNLAAFLLLLDLVGALLVINLMTLVESQRQGEKTWLRRSLFWQYAWNLTGVALCLPMFLLLHITSVTSKEAQPQITTRRAKTLTWSSVWSLLLPIPLLLPALVQASASAIQLGFVIYLLTPVLLIIFQWLFSRTKAQTVALLTPNAADRQSHIKLAYQIASLSSMAIHLGVLAFSLSTSLPEVSLLSLYWPDHNIIQPDSPDILVTGALLFFQWDFIIIVATVVAHDVLSSQRWLSGGLLYKAGYIMESFLGSVLFGPGALLAYSLIRLDYEAVNRDSSDGLQ